MHYLIKDHPQPSARTIAVLAQQIERVGSTFEVLPPSSPLIETSLQTLGASEVSTFYSTGAMVCNSLFGCAYDTMFDEINPFLHEMKATQQGLFTFVRQFFAPRADGIARLA